MMSEPEPWIGIDFGTCRSSAAVLVGSTPQPVIIGDGRSPDMPTAVYIETDGSILVGNEAVNSRIKDLARYADRFKLGIANDRGLTATVLGSHRRYSWTELVAAVLRRIRVAAEAQFNNNQPLRRTILTVPAIYAEGGPDWTVMQEAAVVAGFETVRIVREPEAAATYCDHVLRQEGTMSDGNGTVTLVYDLGGGTFDPVLVRRGSRGYEFVGAGGGGLRCGGIFFDEKLQQDFQRKCPDAWAHLVGRANVEDDAIEAARRIRRRAKDVIEVERFLLDVKHRFSIADVALVSDAAPPTFELDYCITRDEFDALIGPLVDATIESCRSLISRAGVKWCEIERIVLVGGSCRLPIVRAKLAKLCPDSVLKSPQISIGRIGTTSHYYDPDLAVCLGAAICGAEPAPAEILPETPPSTASSDEARPAGTRSQASIQSRLSELVRAERPASHGASRPTGHEVSDFLEQLSEHIRKRR